VGVAPLAGFPAGVPHVAALVNQAMRGAIDTQDHINVAFDLPRIFKKIYLSEAVLARLAALARNGDEDIIEQKARIAVITAMVFGMLANEDQSFLGPDGIAGVAFQGLTFNASPDLVATNAQRVDILQRATRGLIGNFRGVLNSRFTGLANQWTTLLDGDLQGMVLREGHGDDDPVLMPNMLPVPNIDHRLIPQETAEIVVSQAAKFLVNATSWNTGLYAYFYVSMAKRGGITQKKLDSLITEINTANGTNIQSDQDATRRIWEHCGRHITAANAPNAFHTWETSLTAPTALRVRIACQQASGAGLTALTTIVRAIKCFPTFYWSRVFKWFPEETAALRDALLLVNNNPYFGFSAEMGQARATRYKNLAWVSKELLLRISGETSLRAYKGWVRIPELSDTLVGLIEKYATGYHLRKVTTAPDGPERDSYAELKQIAIDSTMLA
jgi:hypothetical protein